VAGWRLAVAASARMLSGRAGWWLGRGGSGAGASLRRAHLVGLAAFLGCLARSRVCSGLRHCRPRSRPQRAAPGWPPGLGDV